MNDKLYKLMNWPRIEGIIYSEEDNPHEVLGPHITGKSVLFQTFQPGASGVFVIAESENKKYKMEMVDESGYFACLAAGKIPEHYEYEVQYGKKESVRVKDAYRYHVGLTENDIDLTQAFIIPFMKSLEPI